MDRDSDGASTRQDPYQEALAYIEPIKRYMKDMEKIATEKKRIDKLRMLKELIEEHVFDHVQSKEVHNKLKNVIIPAKLDGKPVAIKQGEANYAYDRLFGGCLEGSTKVIIEEPWMNEKHYVANLVHFIEFLVRAKTDNICDVRSVVLRTCHTTAETQSALEELKTSALCYDIKMQIKYEEEQFFLLPKSAKKRFHDRNIMFLDDSDYGWTISLTNGLHIFERPGYYSVGAYDFSRRVARENYKIFYNLEQHDLPSAAVVCASAVSLHLCNESPSLVKQDNSMGFNQPPPGLNPDSVGPSLRQVNLAPTSVNGLVVNGSDSFSSPVPSVSAPSSALSSTDQMRGLGPNQLNIIMAGMASMPPPGLEQPRDGGSTPVQEASPPLAIAQQSSSATNESQYNTQPPPNPFTWSLVASKKVPKPPASDILRPASPTTETVMTNVRCHVTSGGYAPRTSHGQQAPSSSKTLKTSLCKHYMNKGNCSFNDKCSFAHGEAELFGLAQIDPRYKTKDCDKFHNSGDCPHNVSCMFRHDETPEQLEALRAGKSFFEAGIGKLQVLVYVVLAVRRPSGAERGAISWLCDDGRPRKHLPNERDPLFNHRDAK